MELINISIKINIANSFLLINNKVLIFSLSFHKILLYYFNSFIASILMLTVLPSLLINLKINRKNSNILNVVNIFIKNAYNNIMIKTFKNNN